MTPAPGPGPDRPQGPPGPQSRLVRRGGFHWHVQTMGSGPPLLLLHGTGASAHSFEALMPLLAERFTVLAPDLPGHASSRPPPGFKPSLPATAAALRELLAELDVAPVVAVGHSAGAALLVRMALDRAIAPRLLVGLGAALQPFRGVARAVLPSAARLLAAASNLGAPRWHADRVERLLRSTGSSLDGRGVELYRRLLERPGHVTATLSMMAHWELEPLFAELPALDVRLLLLAGSADRAVSVAQQRASARRAADGRLVVVGAAGHLLHEEQPAAVARLILDEVDAVASEGAPNGNHDAGPGRGSARPRRLRGVEPE